MNKLKLAAGVILVFLAGSLAGSVGTGIYFKHRIERFSSGGFGHPGRRALLIKKLSDELDLTDTQRIEVEQIVEQSQKRIFAVRRQYMPEIKEITDQSLTLIRDKLNNEQKRELDKLHEKLKRWRGKIPLHQTISEKTTESRMGKTD